MGFANFNLLSTPFFFLKKKSDQSCLKQRYSMKNPRLTKAMKPYRYYIIMIVQ